MTNHRSAPPDLDALHSELDALDTEICARLLRRTALARRLGAVRVETGGTRTVFTDELSTVRHYQELGKAGGEIAVIVLRLARDNR